ncbi:MAG: secretin N-terminal domain-containing protein, partial [Pseudomonadota bacterium]
MNARALRTGLATLLICVIAGCSTGPLRDDPPDAAPAVDPPSAETGTPGLIYVDPRADVDEPETEERTFESYPGTGEFFDREAAGRTPAPDVDDGEIIFNFEGESLSEVVKAILGDLLQENYVIGPNLQGNVTFSTSKPVPMSQVMPILEMLLSWNNATLVYKDGRYHVLPINRAIQGQLRPVIGPSQGQRGYEVRAFPLEYISPSEMEKLLRPYAKETAFINVDNLRGLLILGGTRQELQNYEETIGIFDVDWLSGMSVGIYPLERVEVETVVTELESVFGEGAGTPLAGMFRFLAIERLNAVMVITPQPEYLDTAAEWVERLDRGGSEAGVRLYVYEVKNVKATDLADTLNQVFGEGSNRSSGRDRNRSN